MFGGTSLSWAIQTDRPSSDQRIASSFAGSSSILVQVNREPNVMKNLVRQYLFHLLTETLDEIRFMQSVSIAGAIGWWRNTSRRAISSKIVPR